MKSKITVIVKKPDKSDTGELIDFRAEEDHPGITAEGDSLFCTIAVKTTKDGREYARYIMFPESKIKEIIKQLK